MTVVLGAVLKLSQNLLRIGSRSGEVHPNRITLRVDVSVEGCGGVSMQWMYSCKVGDAAGYLWMAAENVSSVVKARFRVLDKAPVAPVTSIYPNREWCVFACLPFRRDARRQLDFTRFLLLFLRGLEAGGWRSEGCMLVFALDSH